MTYSAEEIAGEVARFLQGFLWALIIVLPIAAAMRMLKRSS
jgi:hypothetical protein